MIRYTTIYPEKLIAHTRYRDDDDQDRGVKLNNRVLTEGDQYQRVHHSSYNVYRVEVDAEDRTVSTQIFHNGPIMLLELFPRHLACRRLHQSQNHNKESAAQVLFCISPHARLTAAAPAATIESLLRRVLALSCQMLRKAQNARFRKHSIRVLRIALNSYSSRHL